MVCLAAFLLASGCDTKREHTLSGRTMGTTYAVKVVTGYFGSVFGLQEKIDRRLHEINQSMSPYLKDSEISRFNRFQKVGAEFPISEDFLRVMQLAARIYALSEGPGWNRKPSGGPLGVRPFRSHGQAAGGGKGCGSAGRHRFDKIEIRDSGALVKRQATVTLDLSSIAKGYGVDQVAVVLRQAGFTDFLVEIGVRSMPPASGRMAAPGGSVLTGPKPMRLSTRSTRWSRCRTRPLPPAAITAISS